MMQKRNMLRTTALLIGISALTMVPAMSLERRLYVTDRSGISVYDIDHGHKLLRKIELPGTGDYKGIAASPQLGKLYVTSFKGDVLICIDLLNDAVVWKKKYGKYADSMAITPDGQTMYLPFRDEDSWWVLNAADGAVKAKIPIGRGKIIRSIRSPPSVPITRGSIPPGLASTWKSSRCRGSSSPTPRRTK